MPDNGDKKTKKIFAHLKREVNFDLCTNCGSCVASCPLGSLVLEEGRLNLKGRCTACGLCYDQCPQISTTQSIAKRIFGEEVELDDDIGFYEKAYTAITKLPEVQVKSQDGGFVTTLLINLLENGFIDGAVVVGVGEEPWLPEARVATTKEELLDCAGSKYSPVILLEGLREAVDYYSLEELAFVGTPCQIKAFRQMEVGDKPVTRLSSKVKLTIGLFCMKSFPYDNFFKEVIEDQLDIDLSKVAKFDVDRGNFIIYEEGKSKKELGLNGISQFAFSPCNICNDFTAELADISVGSVGSASGSSTVLIRTDRGIQAFDYAKRIGDLEIETIKEDSQELNKLRKIASNKKDKAEKEVQAIRQRDGPLPPRIGSDSD